MVKSNGVEIGGRDALVDPLTELLRTGAEQLIYQAVEEELAEVLARHSERRLSDGRAGVVGNGYLPSRELQTGLGPVTVKIPKVRAKTGEVVTFRSALVPPYVRKTKTLEAALPWLYLKGISSGEMGAGAGSVGGAAGEGIVSKYGVTVEAGLGARISERVRGTIGQRAMGLCVGGRCVQWASGGTHEAVRAGGDRRE